MLSKVAGKTITPDFAEARKGDIYQSLLANGRARRSLGWAPQTSLEEGLRRTYEYFLHK